MKIKKLWVSEYKNLKNLEFEFKDGKLISLLVGQNGFGKSNLIEILTMIFRSLFEHTSLKKAKEWSEENNMLEYEIEYSCKRKHLKISGKYQSFEIEQKTEESFTKLNFTEFSKSRKEYLPDYILGYYSGNSPRLKNLIEDIEKDEKSKLKQDQQREGKLNPSLRPFIFTQVHHSEIILFTLVLFLKDSRYQKFINSLLRNYINLDYVHDFLIEFNNPDWPLKIGKNNYSMEYLYANLYDSVEYPFWHLKGKINELLNFLNDYNIGDPNYLVAEKSEEISELKDDVKELLQFDNPNVEKILTEIKDRYETPKDFFDAIDACEIVGIIHRIETEVLKTNGTNPIDFYNLSEGEQQLITTIGLIIIFSEYDTLFLFDEPDTHLNPKWQRHYIDMIKEFMPADHAANSHLIIATHSPLLVQAADENSDLFLFRLSDNQEKIIVDYHDTRVPNWRVDHVLLSKYFDLTSTRPNRIDPFIEERKKIIAKKKLTKKDLKFLEESKNEIGYLPTGETIEELLDKVLLRETADTLRNNRNDSN
ncbi:MAG: AAA family ATPase [Cyclobacteriaceae bacterium]